ncbi:MAG: hypothetical protein SFU25_06680, partial [Candidatus Caenarcaniphilales bacterium]|nr:hypothetical protein [Candidatus Caenarcaniphilales bacterium]
PLDNVSSVQIDPGSRLAVSVGNLRMKLVDEFHMNKLYWLGEWNNSGPKNFGRDWNSFKEFVFNKISYEMKNSFRPQNFRKDLAAPFNALKNFGIGRKSLEGEVKEPSELMDSEVINPFALTTIKIEHAGQLAQERLAIYLENLLHFEQEIENSSFLGLTQTGFARNQAVDRLRAQLIEKSKSLTPDINRIGLLIRDLEKTNSSEVQLMVRDLSSELFKTLQGLSLVDPRNEIELVRVVERISVKVQNMIAFLNSSIVEINSRKDTLLGIQTQIDSINLTTLRIERELEQSKQGPKKTLLTEFDDLNLRAESMITTSLLMDQDYLALKEKQKEVALIDESSLGEQAREEKLKRIEAENKIVSSIGDAEITSKLISVIFKKIKDTLKDFTSSSNGISEEQIKEQLRNLPVRLPENLPKELQERLSVFSSSQSLKLKNALELLRTLIDETSLALDFVQTAASGVFYNHPTSLFPQRIRTTNQLFKADQTRIDGLLSKINLSTDSDIPVLQTTQPTQSQGLNQSSASAPNISLLKYKKRNTATEVLTSPIGLAAAGLIVSIPGPLSSLASSIHQVHSSQNTPSQISTNPQQVPIPHIQIPKDGREYNLKVTLPLGSFNQDPGSVSRQTSLYTADFGASNVSFESRNENGTEGTGTKNTFVTSNWQVFTGLTGCYLEINKINSSSTKPSTVTTVPIFRAPVQANAFDNKTLGFNGSLDFSNHEVGLTCPVNPTNVQFINQYNKEIANMHRVVPVNLSQAKPSSNQSQQEE